MTEYERGPLLPYQITWRSGHIETIRAHQVIWPSGFSGIFGERDERNPRVMLHGEVDGRWKLLLVADEEDILTIRRLETAEATE